MTGIQQAMAAVGSPVAAVTWNPSDKAASVTLSNGDLTATGPTSGDTRPGVRATTGKSSGKWYYEVLVDRIVGANTTPTIGIARSTASLILRVGSDANGWGYATSGVKWTNNSNSAYGTSFVAADVIGIAYDAGAGAVWFSKNGVWQASGDPAAGTNAAFTGITGTIFPMVSVGLDATNPAIATGRFTASSFLTSPPSGFSAWG